MEKDLSKDSAIGRRYVFFLLVFLGMISAFGPFVTDMYLPVLPGMADIFHCDASTAQLGLTMSLIGLAVGQLFFGPLSDKYGRKPVLLSSMIVFCLSTVVILFSPTMEWFNVCRLFQGIGGAGGIVLSRSIATDYYSGKELAKALAIIGAINGIAPVVSPVVGGLVSTFTGWQGIFMVLLAIGIIIVVMCFIFRESHPEQKRSTAGILASFGAFVQLLKMRRFVTYVAIFALSNGILFAYISSASFIIQNHYGFTPLVFAICFAVNSVSIGIGSGISVKIKGMERALATGSCVLVLSCAAQLVLKQIAMPFAVYEGLTVLALVGVGIILTSGTTLAMNEGRAFIGAASALLGSSGFLFGGIVSPVVGIGDILLSTMTVMSVCSAGIAILTAFVYRHRK